MGYSIMVSGRVQGVGCRYYIATVARRMKLKGCVSNSYDGRVIILLHGSDLIKVEEFIINIKNNKYKYSFLGTITSIHCDEYVGTDYSGDYTF